MGPYHRLVIMAGGGRKDGYACICIISDMASWPKEGGYRRENKYAREPGTYAYCGSLLLFSPRGGAPVAKTSWGSVP